MATLAPLPNTLIFHSWHLIQGCTPSSDPSYEELLENKIFFYSTKAFLFSLFWDIYRKTANTGSKSFVLRSSENICNTEGIKSSVSKKKRCRVHDQSHTQWCREQKKSIIMKYYLSAVPLEGKKCQGKFSPWRGYSRNPSHSVLDCF